MVFRTILFILLMTKNLQTNASGFDAYSSCYRTSRKRQDLPCDFASQTWCTIPGNSYPWHAVRRFVRENQGLMRRMYGDERHISVLRAELESNDIEYFGSPSIKEEVRQRYSKNMDRANFVKMFINAEGRKLFDEKTTKIEKVQKSIEEKSNNVLYQNQIKGSKEEELKNLPKNKIVNKVTTTMTSTVEPSEATPELNHTTTESTNFTSSVPTVTTDSVNPTTGFLYNQTAPQNATNGEEFDYAETEEIPTTTSLDGLTTTENVFEEAGEEEEGEEENTPKDKEDYVESVEEAEVEEQAVVEEQKPLQPMPMVRLKGINACPVKEEVVAPFWANNTRGEVLALLNLYPFEQYVHWEKCTYEHKQMFCREGCRCEQQYRLHRLLAYDPNNECRGIFSDWFRFPSCCVCKCYDLPMEFRLTSRSPRFQGPDYHRTFFNQAQKP